MSISSVILFVSSTSHASIPCIQFVQNSNLPISIVRLDTVEDRHKAANGYYLKITEVPTLAVIYNGGDNIQLSIGSEKTLRRLQEFLPPPTIPPPPQDTIASQPKKKKKEKVVHFEDEEDEEIELLTKEKPSKKKKKISPTLETKITAGEKKDSGGMSIYEMAKKMEKERSSTLGYDER
jgi:hypothetical protein